MNNVILKDFSDTQTDDFLEKLAQSLDISDGHNEKAKEKYESVGQWLGRENSVLAPYNPEIYPQGSFRLGTVIKPLNDEDEYDIDLVCKVHLTKEICAPIVLKELVGREMKGYVKAHSMNNPAEEGRRCWTLNYADGAQFHLDVLPALPDGKEFKEILESRQYETNQLTDFTLAITDQTMIGYSQICQDWPRSNPKGYAEWFKERMKVNYGKRLNFISESMDANIEDVPEYMVKTPLQQVVQILKRHRDIMFEDDSDNKPISIIITTLAAHAYNEEGSLSQALTSIINSMSQHVTSINNVTWVANPVNPLENFADKWIEHPIRKTNFYRWLNQLKTDFLWTLSRDTPHQIANNLRETMGSRAINEAIQGFPQTRLSKVVSNIQSFVSVRHRQQSRWQIVNIKTYNSHIDASYHLSGYRPKKVTNNGFQVPKRCNLRFELKTNVPWPYKVYWQVVNTGNEAALANCLRGGFSEGSTSRGGRVRTEGTQYTGNHWVECFIVKNGKCVSRTGEFIVNIE